MTTEAVAINAAAEARSASVFRARALTKIYRIGEVEVHALRCVGLDLYDDELVVFLGPSGSGKSTLLNILGGLDAPTSGDVVFRDHVLTGATDHELTRFRREHVGFVFQFYNPIRGRVLTVHRESEATITAGLPILDIGDLSTLEIVIDVLSREAVRIAPGQDVIIDGWGGSAPLHARVSRIEPSAFTKVSALGIEEQRVNVIATLEDPPPSLGERFEVQAPVVVWSGTGLKVPSTAVFRDGERWAVFAVRNGRARLQPVTVGHRSAEEVEITSGLPPGAAIINHPSDQIRNGVRVVGEPG